jgi:hypothetical protein
MMNIALKTTFFSLLATILLFSCATDSEPQSGTLDIFKPETAPQQIHVTQADAALIGQKIWMNEGSGKVSNLTVWNKGETFASLGIGHFIWYPAGQEGPYDEQFPKLLKYLQQQRIALPEWLQTLPDCPWMSRADFYDEIDSGKMLSLRHLMKNTISHQVQFIIKRLEGALPKMMDVLPTEEQRTHVRQQFYRVAQEPSGVYALIDYVNFKGEGTSPKERYKGHGWGLLQVLENMSGDSDKIMVDFAQAADLVLTRRVENAPRDESRWLPGWRNRLKTYTYDL